MTKKQTSNLTPEDSRRIVDLVIEARNTARKAEHAATYGDPTEAYDADEKAWDALRQFVYSLERSES